MNIIDIHNKIEALKAIKKSSYDENIIQKLDVLIKSLNIIFEKQLNYDAKLLGVAFEEEKMRKHGINLENLLFDSYYKTGLSTKNSNTINTDSGSSFDPALLATAGIGILAAGIDTN